MTRAGRYLIPFLALTVWGTVAAWLLLPELASGRLDLNDHVLHKLIVKRMAEAIEGGRTRLTAGFRRSAWGIRFPEPTSH